MKRIWLVTGLIIAILLVACTSSTQPSVREGNSPVPAEQAPAVEPVRLRVAQQFGLGYAALTIADELSLFEKYFPGLQVTWMQMNSSAAINEAFNSGELDAAVMDIPSFLIGWDEGVPLKVASGMCVMPLTLQTFREDINSLVDFSQDDKIAYPTPGSIQQILLSMAAEKELGSPTALDDIGVAMPDPDAAAALINQRDITGHFTSPPYNFEELKIPGIKTVVDGTEAFGSDFTFLVAVATTDLFENNPRAYAAFVMGLAEATEFINQNPDEAATILAPSLGLDVTTTQEYLTWPGMNFVTTPLGLMGFSDFMLDAGYLSKVPGGLSDIAFTNVLAAIGEQQGDVGALEQLQFRP